MTARNYVLLCASITVLTVLSILFVPGLSDTIESRMLTFLVTNSRS
jgi:hypothetical protein